MLPSFMISFRETFEAALVIGIMLGYLTKTANDPYKKYVYAGALGGVAISIFTAIAFNSIAGGFTGTGEQLFEGSTMIAAAFLVTTMIIWMAGQRNISENIKQKVRESLDRKYGMGLALFSMFAVLREGVEVILFLNAAAFSSGSSSIVGASAGIVGAMAISYLFFKAIVRLNLKHFFLFTGILLTLIAAGLFAHGLNEFQEAGLIPHLSQQAWDTKWLLDDKSSIGGMVRSVFGYNDNPSRLEAFAYAGFLVGVAYFWRSKSKK